MNLFCISCNFGKICFTNNNLREIQNLDITSITTTKWAEEARTLRRKCRRIPPEQKRDMNRCLDNIQIMVSKLEDEKIRLKTTNSKIDVLNKIKQLEEYIQEAIDTIKEEFMFTILCT